MTIGEKIQHYRKKLNISQEELGNQLSVSRQSVSLWEKDVTMPTVDNIKRLAEIFSVTVDQLMSTEEVDQETESKEILYTLTEKDVKKVRFSFVSRYVYLLIFFVAIVILWGSSLLSYDGHDKAGLCFVLGMFVSFVAVYIGSIRTVNKSFAPLLKNCTRKVYTMKFLDDCIQLKVYIDRQPDLFKMVKYSEIKSILCIDNLYWVQLPDFNFIINKNQLPFGCQFFSLLNRPTIKVVSKKTTNGFQMFSWILFVATLLSLFVGMFTVVFAMKINNAGEMEFVKYIWAMYFALPIPIASIVVGCVLKKQGRPYKKNLIAGIIFTVLLCLYGSFWFLV